MSDICTDNHVESFSIPMTQKFEIGDICKIVRADNTFCYPEKKDCEATGYGLYVMIIGSYGQIFPNISKYNLNDYEVFVPKHLNPNVYDYKDGRYSCKIPNFGECGGNTYEEFGWSWVKDFQMDFIKKPNEEDLKHLYNYGRKLKWKKYKEKDSAWFWDSWEDMYKNYLEGDK